MLANFTTFLSTHQWIFILVAIWTIPWKGVALWRAARNRSLVWFVVLLIVNTFGILEIIYIFSFSKKTEATLKPEAEVKTEAETSQSVKEQEVPKPEKIVLDIKREEKSEEKPEVKEDEKKSEEKPILDEDVSKS